MIDIETKYIKHKMRNTGMVENHQDWQQVVWKKNKPSSAKDALTEAQRRGEEIETQLKRNPDGAKMYKLDEANESYKTPVVTHEFSVALQQARVKSNLTRKQLAQKINKTETVITQYETKKAVPDGQVISQLNRVLGIVLPKIKK